MDDDAPGGDADELPGKAISVTELNADISKVIERSNDLEFDFLIGDVSDNSTSNGTQYFQLVDDGTGVQCLAFAGTRQSIPDFENGDRVAVKGRLNYYEERGQCSIYVDDVVLLGDSHYHRQIEKLREKLTEDGVFEYEKKQELPAFPSTIGIVTSKGSDAEEDAINAIHDRHPDVDITLCHSRVQGLAALEDLCNAITYLDAHSDVDVVIVTRGGGSEQDLHAFNTEGVTRTIAKMETPVVTAVGHENDRPLVDDAADDRAMTPTEIGSVVVPSKTQIQESVSRNRTQVQNNYAKRVSAAMDAHREAVEQAYTTHTKAITDEYSHQIENAFERTTTTHIADLRNRVETAYTVLEQEKEHEEETKDLKVKEQRYKIVALVLLFLLILMGILWVVS